ncbi:unnamed protein product [Orchesella dallaii]|uniref:Uncharacterized protein n=1 Tax=Orchesella dallaii TaxID=48710 RepID=A0ABP1Q9X7_9HEXA
MTQMECKIILLLVSCQILQIISSPLIWQEFNEQWTAMERNLTEDGLVDIGRSKRAIQAFAPHITFQHKPGQNIPRAKYGDTCNVTFYENSTKLVYLAAEQEDDNELGTKVNETMLNLLNWLKVAIANGTEIPNNVSESWLQLLTIDCGVSYRWCVLVGIQWFAPQKEELEPQLVDV